MSYNVQYTYQLLDRITPELNKIQRELKQTGRVGEKVAHSTTGSFNKLRTSLIGFTGAFVGFHTLRGVVDTLAEFGTEMSKIQAVTSASSGELEKMKDLSLKLGKTTEFSASQAASGMKFLGMAGFKTNSILSSMPAILDLATASGMDLAGASDIASNILTGFNLRAKEAGRMADVMAKTVSSANTNVIQLGEAMKYVAPIADSSNVSLELTAAVIGRLSDGGLQASMAGTGLRRIISELAKPTKEATDVLKKYNLSVQDVNVSQHGLMEVLEKLKPISKSTADSFTLFGDRGAPAFQVISQGIGKVKELEIALKSSKGTAQEMANVMRDNLGGDIKALQSSIQGLVLTLGESGLNTALRKTIQIITGGVRGLSGDLEGMAQGFLGQDIGKFVYLSAQAALGNLDAKTPKISFPNEQERTFKTFNQQVNLGGELNINVGGLPQGSKVEYFPTQNSQLSPRINTIAR